MIGDRNKPAVNSCEARISNICAASAQQPFVAHIFRGFLCSGMPSPLEAGDQPMRKQPRPRWVCTVPSTSTAYLKLPSFIGSTAETKLFAGLVLKEGTLNYRLWLVGDALYGTKREEGRGGMGYCNKEGCSGR